MSLIMALLLAPLVALPFGVYWPKPTRTAHGRVLKLIARAYFMLGAPLLFLAVCDSGSELDCCDTEVFFSPEHRLSAYALLLLVWVAFTYSQRKSEAGPPLVEFLVNAALGLGFWFNAAVFLHAAHLWQNAGDRGHSNPYVAIAGCAPIAVLLLTQFVANHHRNLEQLAQLEPSTPGTWRAVVRRVLAWPLLLQLPVFLLLSAPLLALSSALLVLLGQRPDAIVRVFTDTHHQGLSRLTAECLEVDCGGHYLCTIAAHGHPRWVKPLRLGVRGGRDIVCNRQLLIANAFEQIVQERLPRVHRVLRTRYDQVGALLGRHRHLFAKRWVADLVYLLMKPAELAFLVTLYLHDSRPEQRIARQYQPKR